MENKEKALIELLETRSLRIENLLMIIRHIQNEIKLSNTSYKNNDYEEMKKINDELIEFIDKLMVEEYDL